MPPWKKQQLRLRTRMRCRFALPADPNKEPIVFPRCAFVDCEFDHTAALICPFASGGSFAVTDNENCPDFMKVG